MPGSYSCGKFSEQLPKVFTADQWYEMVTKNASGILDYFNNVKCLRQVGLSSYSVGCGPEFTEELYVVLGIMSY